MTVRRLISRTEFADLLATFEHTAFRLELQPRYHEPGEAEAVERFSAGTPLEPTENPNLRDWIKQVTQMVGEGKRFERVRVHDDPPTPYQRWERWAGAWNIRAGEQIRYMTRARAHEVGLLPAAGQLDWWLLDSSKLVTMSFDQDGARLGDELVTDAEAVVQACAWRDLAVHHSTLEQLHGASA